MTEYEQRVRESFGRQVVMATIGARLARVGRGEVDVEMPYRAELPQQHGYIHAGIVSTILDSACGYAAFSLMPPDAAVLSVEFKVNLLAPAKGEKLIARARVKKRGRVISVCDADAFAVTEGTEKLVASMTATMMCIEGRPGLAG